MKKNGQVKKNPYKQAGFKTGRRSLAVTAVVVVISIVLLIFSLNTINCKKESTCEEAYLTLDTLASIIASVITAIPGVFCGVFAIYQTERINRLEARYHRPALGLREASMKITRIHDKKYQSQTGIRDYKAYRFCKWLIQEKPEKFFGRLSLQLTLELKNEIEIYDIVIEQICFCFGDECYSFEADRLPDEWKEYRKCARIFRDDKYICIINWDLYPYKLLLEEKKNGLSEKKFWQNMEYFSNYEGYLVDDCLILDVKIQARVYYQYAASGYDRFSINLQWDAKNGPGRNGYESVNQTYAGRITYFEGDVK